MAEKLGIFVNLDDILDTRLATLYLIHKDLAKAALDAGYFTRDEDSFPHLSKEKFNKFYSQRNAIVLQEAIPTRVLAFLREMILHLNHQAVETPYHSGPKIYLNVYPYDLTPGEVELMVKALAIQTGQTCDITAVYMSPKEITPQFCRSNLGCIFFYNASEWLETHASNDGFKNCQIPDVTLYVPAIYHGTRPTEEQIQEISVENLDPFRAWEISGSGIINGCVLETGIFCVDFDKHFQAAKEKAK